MEVAKTLFLPSGSAPRFSMQLAIIIDSILEKIHFGFSIKKRVESKKGLFISIIYWHSAR
ncbi:MAG: hypothetical protein A2007_04480 [Verrucomicrobia bacterium GWC2_42_7]|nr:MAG: hypothetical protein A2007_04480 [Verrucomicrobia bacterium GWC2_42_7]